MEANPAAAQYLTPVLKLVVGPALIWALRQFAPTIIKKFPVWLQPVAAALINIVIAVATGTDPVLSIAALVEAIKVAVETGGVVKGIDLVKGRVNTVTAEEKAKLASTNVD